MVRFITLVWDDHDRSQQRTAQRFGERIHEHFTSWRTQLRSGGCAAYVSPIPGVASGSLRLHSGLGTIVGDLFRNGGGAAVGSDGLTQRESEEIIATHGTSLTKKYWGSYVAFLIDPRSPATYILRSPLGQLGCFSMQRAGIRIYFSSVQDIAVIDGFTPSISHDYILRSLCRTTLRNETGLKEVEMLGDGECVEARGAKVTKHAYWDLVTAARQPAITDASRAAEEIRTTTMNCVQAWGSRFDSVMLRLSGGLDSSIVLGCLTAASQPPRILAVNRYSAGGDSDERAFARFAASSAGCELLELERTPDISADDVLAARLTETPRNYLNLVAQAAIENRIARGRRLPVVMSGSWGDELFYAGYVRLCAADYVYERGLRPELIKIALGAAEQERLSIWAVLRGALRMGLVRHQWSMEQAVRPLDPLINWDAVDNQLPAKMRQPAATPVDRYLPPGKQYQIATLSGAVYVGGTAPYRGPDDPDYVSPLLSQPLTEACLRVPTYVLSSGNINRSLARKAFEGVVHPHILNRPTKGGQERYTAEIFKRLLPFVRGLLLDGYLVRNGLLDRRKLEAALSDRPSGVVRGMRKLSQHVSTEIWISLWESQKTRANSGDSEYFSSSEARHA